MLLPAVLIVLGAGLLCVAYGVLIERRWYRLARYRLDILPANAPGSVSVLHLSDLHFVRGDRKMTGFLAGLPPADVTVVTGDILGEPQAVEEAAAVLRPTRGRLASYFVLGSNDYYVTRRLNYFRYFLKRRKVRRAKRGRAPELIARLEADGWTHLPNVRLEVALNGLPVELVGLDDPNIGRQDLRGALRRAPARFGIAVVHSPDAAPELSALGYDFIVAGHTHGGQVRMPLVGALVTNSHLPRRLSSGLVRMGDAYMHVSPGIGTSKYAPFRFLCRPEAALLELCPRPA
ncbi:MAG: metallophosphoesterase [Actinomycetota bacterium]